jgi:NAD binding domain of 6-phosphogluconate dehydrogenase
MTKPQLAYVSLSDNPTTDSSRLDSEIWVHSLLKNSILTCTGQAMAANIQKYLAKEKYPSLIVFNRTASRADPLTEQGVIVSKSLEEAVEKSDIIFTCVQSLSIVPNFSLPKTLLYKNISKRLRLSILLEKYLWNLRQFIQMWSKKPNN